MAEIPELQESNHVGHARRLTALDGLRGIAALIVVFHHALMATATGMADQYTAGLPQPTSGSLVWWVSRTPLHLFWAGPEAVLVFFVLSGFVLTLPAVKLGRAWVDRSYWPRRLIRLYLPVWAALLIAGIIHMVQARQAIPGGTWWLNAHVSDPTVPNGIQTAVLLSGPSPWAFTSVLWSLTWEIWFSLTLPLVLVIALWFRDRPKLAILSCLVAVLVTARGAMHAADGFEWQAVEFMPVFWIGVSLALHRDRIRSIAVRAGVPLVAVGALLLTAPYWARPSGAVPGWSEGIAVLGAAGVVAAALDSQIIGRLFSGRAVRWLGSRSFSLYLVHEPIVVTAAFAWGHRPPVGTFLFLIVPVSLIIAEVFWRCVERPSVALAAKAGLAASGRFNHRATGDARLPAN